MHKPRRITKLPDRFKPTLPSKRSRKRLEEIQRVYPGLEVDQEDEQPQVPKKKPKKE